MRYVSEIFKMIPKRNKIKLIFFTLAKSALGLLDLFGILLMGLLIAKTSQDLGVKIEFTLFNYLNRLKLIEIAVLVLCAFVAKSVFSVVLTKSLNDELAKAETTVSTNLYERILNSDFNKISKFSKQNIIFGLNTSATSSIINLLNVIATITSEGFMLLLVITAFAYVDVKLTFFIFIYFLVIGLILNKFIGRLSRLAGSQNAIYGIKANQIIEDSLSAFREVKVLRKEKVFISSFSSSRLISARAIASVNYISALPRFIVEPALMVGAVLLAGFSLNSPGGLATLGIFLTGGLRIMAAMLPLQMAFNSLKNLVAMAEKFIYLNHEFINQKSLNLQDSKSVENTSNNVLGPVGLKISDLNFQYNQGADFAISDLNLEIRPGSVIALIGTSGSGKSTLADLIVGGVKQQSGRIEFNDLKGERLDRSQVSIGYVPQDPGIISGTLLDNITFNLNNKEYDLASLSYALKISHLESVIVNLHEGLNSQVGEQMDALSGGQFQRVGLARAIYSDPNILVLDEATSALDMETENAIKDALMSLKNRVTIVVIAHRLSTVKNADHVYVLESGKITDSGNFQELVLRNKLVARYVELSDLTSD